MNSSLKGCAQRIVENNLGKSVATIQRFPTGLSHFVFDVATRDGFRFVVRIARPERAAEFERGIYWQEKLKNLKIPLPEIYHVGEINHHPFAIYERLPGADLEIVYPSLSAGEKRDIARSVAEIQWEVHRLDRQHFASISPWVDVLHVIVNRTEREMLAAGSGKRPFVDRVREQIQERLNYFTTVRPVAFLYDLNVRNVIVQDGKVTGIIDVDDLWFGDSLLAIGRGKTILLLMQQDCDFITHWCHWLNLSERQQMIVEFYALLYSVRFMGTMGQVLNGNASPQTDPRIAHLLDKIANDLLKKLEKNAV